MNLRGKVLSVAALALVGCGNQVSNVPQAPSAGSEGIVNGTDVTTPNQYSQHTVFLQMQLAQGIGSCTGSILDSQTILTAGHCIVTGVKKIAIGFALNTQDARTLKPDQIRKADIVAVYPKFQPEPEPPDDGSAPKRKLPSGPPPIPTLAQIEQMLDRSGDVDYDVALIHFSGGLPAGYSPVKLGTSPSLAQAGTQLHMIGYGLSRVASQMQEIDGQPVFVPVPDQTTVGQLRETDVAIGQYNTKVGMILTDGHQTGVCSGDSGGPAFVKDPATGEIVQVGIAEAVANAYCNSVSMHTAIFPFLDWIDQMSGKMADMAKTKASALQVSFVQ